MRWILLSITLAAIVVAILTPSPGWLGLALFVTLLGLLGTVFAFAHNRIGDSARAEELNAFELELLRKHVREQATGDDDDADA